MIEAADIEFSQSEANLLLNLLHEAVLSKGLKVAKDAVYIQSKLEAAFSMPKDKDLSEEKTSEN